jgi:hypothetical protein
MTDWLAPVRSSLDARTSPATVFFRDDDVGWDDERLALLLDCFEVAGLPLDLAVIPAALSDSLAAALLARRASGPRLGLHQHGWTHANHEVVGRKCEFGTARPLAMLYEDLRDGRQVLQGAFGQALDPIFTPPWNRCVPDLGQLLLDLGLTVLSRDATATPLGLTGLHECPVAVDWSARRGGLRRSPGEIAADLAKALASDRPSGVLFHHAVMDAPAREMTGQLLRLLAGHASARCVPLTEAAYHPSAPAAAEITTMEAVE